MAGRRRDFRDEGDVGGYKEHKREHKEEPKKVLNILLG